MKKLLLIVALSVSLSVSAQVVTLCPLSVENETAELFASCYIIGDSGTIYRCAFSTITYPNSGLHTNIIYSATLKDEVFGEASKGRSVTIHGLPIHPRTAMKALGVKFCTKEGIIITRPASVSYGVTVEKGVTIPEDETEY